MTAFKKSILFSVGRLVSGSFTKPQTEDLDGNPLTVKEGVNKGQPSVRWFFAVAIPKSPDGRHWAHEEWGKQVWAIGHSCFPAGQASQDDFSWKIVDGDSTKLNKGKRPTRPCDREGHKGHWIISFSSGFAPKCYNSDGSKPMDPAAFKLGMWVQVNGTVDGNENLQKSGVYMNHDGVAFQWADKEIFTGVDPTTVGFGKGVNKPAGASAMPPGSFTPPAALPPAAPAVPGVPAPTYAAPPGPAAPVAPTAVAPSPSFVPAAIAAAPPPPPVAPVAPPAGPSGKFMTAAAQGVPYTSFIAQGWNDEQMISAGYLLRG